MPQREGKFHFQNASDFAVTRRVKGISIMRDDFYRRIYRQKNLFESRRNMQVRLKNTCPLKQLVTHQAVGNY
jgi:hypothetical protein